MKPLSSSTNGSLRTSHRVTAEDPKPVSKVFQDGVFDEVIDEDFLQKAIKENTVTTPTPNTQLNSPLKNRTDVQILLNMHAFEQKATSKNSPNSTATTSTTTNTPPYPLSKTNPL